jgi:hypothetical protein
MLYDMQMVHTRDCPPVDLLIRTSREQQLSDFLLCQNSHALLVMTCAADGCNMLNDVQVMHTRDCPPVEIRTFGEQRLSNCMLWQSSQALLVATCAADIATCYMTCRFCTRATAHQWTCSSALPGSSDHLTCCSELCNLLHDNQHVMTCVTDVCHMTCR